MKEFKTQKEIAEFIVENGTCVGFDEISCTDGDYCHIGCPLYGGVFNCDDFNSAQKAAKAYLASLEGNEAECECVTKTKIKREFTKNVTYELNGETYSPEEERAKIADLVTSRNMINAQLKEMRATLKAFENSGL